MQLCKVFFKNVQNFTLTEGVLKFFPVDICTFMLHLQF